MSPEKNDRTPESKAGNARPDAAGDLHISRLFNARREAVWTAWTDVAHLSKWSAPKGCTLSFVRFDFRVGGGFHSCIHNPTFGDCWCVAEYREIVKPERIVYSMSIADPAGNKIDSVTAGHDPEWPRETVVTITFTEQGGQTLLNLHQTVRESLARRTGAYPSWLEMLENLAASLQEAT